MESAGSGEIGEVLHLAKSGRLVIRLRQGVAAKPGQMLIDEGGKKIGKIVELLGPVRAPYASVMPLADRVGKLAGAKVYDGGFSERKHRDSSRLRKRSR
jgi:RNA-binding protein